jgi:hypothetical protein
MKVNGGGFSGILLLVLLVLVAGGLYYLKTNKTDLSNMPTGTPLATSFQKLVDEGISEEDIDKRCVFKIENHDGEYRVIGNLLTNATTQSQLSAYGHLYDRVEYLPDRQKALAYGNDEKMKLLDFVSCQISDFPPQFEFNKNYFIQTLRSISPSGIYLVFEIYHGFKTPPFPGTENNYSQADADKNGIWLYNFNNRKNYHIRILPVGTETSDLEIDWKTDLLVLNGIDCPDAGCLFDLQRY